jgi:hypothetical protein
MRRKFATCNNHLITGRPLKRVGDSREPGSRSARQRDVIPARPNQGRQRLTQTPSKEKKRLVIDDVWSALCRNGRLYGIERYAGNRRVRRKIQVRGILDRKPFVFPVNRLPSHHMLSGHLSGVPHALCRLAVPDRNAAAFLREFPGRQPCSFLRFAELQDELVGVSANRFIERFCLQVITRYAMRAL